MSDLLDGAPVGKSKGITPQGIAALIFVVFAFAFGCKDEGPQKVRKITIYNEKREVVREYVGNWFVDEGTPYSPFIAVWGREGEAKFPRSYSYEVTTVTLDR